MIHVIRRGKNNHDQITNISIFFLFSFFNVSLFKRLFRDYSLPKPLKTLWGFEGVQRLIRNKHVIEVFNINVFSLNI